MEAPLCCGRCRGACGHQFTSETLPKSVDKGGYGTNTWLAEGAKTGDEIAFLPGQSRITVFRALRNLGLSRLSFLEPKPEVRRYEWGSPGDMLHLDIKRLGKIDGIGHRKAGTRWIKRRKPGWEYLHVCVEMLHGWHIQRSMQTRLRNLP